MRSTQSPPSGALYRLFWRWHFYAGMVIAPFLVILSLTGMIYLFDKEINDAIYPNLRFASSQSPPKPLSAWVEGALREYPGSTVARIYTPTNPKRTAELFITTATDEKRRVFIDPPTGKMLGSYVYTHTLVGFADVMHGSLMMGDSGSAVMELAACWALVMIVTGVYLWFPRVAGASGSWWPRFTLHGRRKWKDIHKLTGLYASVLIVFLIVSGLPWATVWGDYWLRPISDMLDIGYPPGKKSAHAHAHHVTEGPWALQKASMPVSKPLGSLLSVDEVAAILNAQDMQHYRLIMPQDSQGVYFAYTYPDQPQGQRTLQINPYSGEVMADIGFADYGALAKVVEIGVALHLGNYFGRINQVVLLIPCVVIIGLVVTGFMLWWKRKPQGAMGAPVVTGHERLGLRWKVLIAAFVVLFPLAGISFLAVLGMDSAWQHWRRRQGEA